MLRRRKESMVMVLIEDHLKKVEESLQCMLSELEDYLQGKGDSAESLTSMTHKAESEADDIRRDIVELLHRGAFLPLFREDVMVLVGTVDEIASHAQACCRFIAIQRPEIPDDLKDDFLKMARRSAASLPPLRESVTKMSEDFSIALENAASVHDIESEVDKLVAELSRRIFSADMNLAHKMHLKHFVDLIEDISDTAEDAAEILETLVVKKQV
jgi:predicted phosphate transport protein (TIGR00153 family)